MKHRLYFAIVLCGLTVAAPGIAQEKMTLGDLKAGNAQRLSRSDLQTLVPGANVVNIAANGSERRWTNGKDGMFVASTTNAGAVGLSVSTTGNGSWSIDDDGRYCATIEWPSRSEKWCRVIYRMGDAYYGIGSLKRDTNRAYRYEFKK